MKKIYLFLAAAAVATTTVIGGRRYLRRKIEAETLCAKYIAYDLLDLLGGSTASRFEKMKRDYPRQIIRVRSRHEGLIVNEFNKYAEKALDSMDIILITYPDELRNQRIEQAEAMIKSAYKILRHNPSCYADVAEIGRLMYSASRKIRQEQRENVPAKESQRHADLDCQCKIYNPKEAEKIEKFLSACFADENLLK